MQVADAHACSADYVRRVMGLIQKEFPKPTPKHPNESRCKSCGAPIVWMGKHPCDIPILKGVTADGQVHRFRQLHSETCPDADKWRGGSGIDAGIPTGDTL